MWQEFNFNRSDADLVEGVGGKRRKLSDVFEEREASDDLVREVGEGVGHDLPVVDGQGNSGSSRFDVRNLLSDGVKVHHLKDLQAAARLLDELRQQDDDAVEHELDLSELKLELSASDRLCAQVSWLALRRPHCGDDVQLPQICERRV